MTDAELIEASNAWFESIHNQDPAIRQEIELMYQAFKGRLIHEMKVEGSAHEGVAYGFLKQKTQA